MWGGLLCPPLLIAHIDNRILEMPYYTPTGLIKLGKAIRLNRERRGLSQRQLAKLAQVAHTTVERLEEGIFQNPKNDTLAKIASQLDMTLAEMIALASETEDFSSVKKRTCSEMLPLISEMPTSELRKLFEAIQQRLQDVDKLENNNNFRS